MDFPDISYRAFQHPTDTAALAALKRVPGLPALVKKLSIELAERWFRVAEQPNCVEISSRQYPSLYKPYVAMTETLSIYPVPKLYIRTAPIVNAFTSGVKEHHIMLYSGLLDLLTEKEILAVIGHELGHIKCHHVQYSSVAEIMLMIGSELINQIPVIGGLVNLGVRAKLYDWYRKAELSCDRAALLTTQNEDAVYSMLAKLAGYSKSLKDEVNIQAMIEQAHDLENLGEDSAPDWFFKLISTLELTHPHLPIRVRELSNWALSQSYFDILEGNYPLMDNDEFLED